MPIRTKTRPTVLLAALSLLIAIAAPATTANAAPPELDAMKAYLAANPGGAQINATEIAYDAA